MNVKKTIDNNIPSVYTDSIYRWYIVDGGV